jgi:hypothetical protein
MRKVSRDFWSNIDWGKTAIGGGAGALSALLFNRFILGNKTWKSHAIASGIGALLGGGGTALYNHLDRLEKQKSISTSTSKKLSPERIAEIKKYEETPTVTKAITTTPEGTAGTRIPGFAAAGHVIGVQADRAQQKLMGARLTPKDGNSGERVIMSMGADGKPVPVRVHFGKIGYRGSINSEDVAKLPFNERVKLFEKIQSGELDVSLSPEQRTNPLLFGEIKRPGAAIRARRNIIESMNNRLEALPNIEDAAWRVENAQESLHNAQAYNKKLSHVFQRAEKKALAAIGTNNIDRFIVLADRRYKLKQRLLLERKKRANLAKELEKERASLDSLLTERSSIKRTALEALRASKRPVRQAFSAKTGIKHMLRRPWAKALSVLGALYGGYDAVNAMEEHRKLREDRLNYYNR